MIVAALLSACLATAPAQDFELTPEALEQLVEGCAQEIELILGLELERPIDARIETRDRIAMLLFEENRELFMAQVVDEGQADAQARQFAIGASQDLLAKYSWKAGAILVSRENLEAQSLDLEIDELNSEEVVRAVLLHELVHAADDLRYDLGALYAGCQTSEEVLALSSLVEGHAQMVAHDACAELGLLDAFQAYTRGIGALSPSMERTLGEAGARIARVRLAETRAQYVAGEAFVRRLRAAGGGEAVERAFREPPRDMETVLNPEWYLLPERRPFSGRGLEHALDGLEPHFPAGEWTWRQFTALPAQLREALSPLRGEDVERLLASIEQNRGRRGEDKDGFVTAVLYQLATPEDADFLVAKTLELTRLQKVGETYEGTTILTTEYADLEAEAIQGSICKRTLEAAGSELDVMVVIAHSGAFAAELVVVEIDLIDGAKAVAMVVELLARVGETPPPDGSFDRLPEGAVPAGWEALETSSTGTPARWQVVADATAPSPGKLMRVAAKNSGQTFNLLLAERSAVADVEVSVQLRAESGVEDQGGGLVWRALDADNYYVTRWNPLEDNLRLYKVEGGVRTQLQSAQAALDPEVWHELRAVASGDHMTVFLDGEKLLDHEDGTFAGGGRVGLWTKADASCAFDDFEVNW